MAASRTVPPPDVDRDSRTPGELPRETVDAVRHARGDGWPAAALDVLRDADFLRWGIPRSYGGIEVTPVQRLRAYIDLADADLVACFVLTQRDSAISRLVGADGEPVRKRWLPPLASGEAFATVGISHLTTSRQHTRPAVAAERTAGGFRLSGTCPWATSASHADLLVTGGQLDDGTQLLAAVDVARQRDRIRPGEPMRLHALGASETGTIELADVEVRPDEVIAGPVAAVMSQGSGGGAGSLTTSALAVGLSQRAIRMLADESSGRDELGESSARLETELAELACDLLDTAGGLASISSESLRSRANSLALRSTQALLTATKGAGFIVGHPAELAVREAMFFLVWSCPRPVAEAAMAEFACLDG